MRPKPVRFNPALEPISQPLPSAIAEGIGRAIARHSYLEWILGQVLYSLLEISIKQGRKVVQRPEPARYAAAIEGLFAYHKLEARFDFAALGRRVETADRSRDMLAHGVCMRDMSTRAGKVFLVRGSWARKGDDKTLSADLWPEAPVLDRTLLARLRDDIEAAVTNAERLQQVTDKSLRRLHEMRRTQPGLNRRRSDR